MSGVLAAVSLNPSFWDVIWWMITFLAVVLLFTLVVYVFIDNFRRTDHHGWAKALWTILIIFLPVIGIIAYIIARPAEA
jgi:hypothetical protein